MSDKVGSEGRKFREESGAVGLRPVPGLRPGTGRAPAVLENRPPPEGRIELIISGPSVRFGRAMLERCLLCKGVAQRARFPSGACHMTPYGFLAS